MSSRLSQCGVYTLVVILLIRHNNRSDRVLLGNSLYNWHVNMGSRLLFFFLRETWISIYVASFQQCCCSKPTDSSSVCTQAVYHHDYVHSIRGKVAPTTKTVDLERALHAYKLQSEVSSEKPTRCPAEIQEAACKGRAVRFRRNRLGLGIFSA